MPPASMMQPTYPQHMQEEMPQNISYNHNGTFNAPPMVTHPMSPPGMSTGEMSPHFIGPGSPQYNYPMEAMVPDQKPSVQVRIISRLFGQHVFFYHNFFFRRYLIKTLWSGARLLTMSSTIVWVNCSMPKGLWMYSLMASLAPDQMPIDSA